MDAFLNFLEKRITKLLTWVNLRERGREVTGRHLSRCPFCGLSSLTLCVCVTFQMSVGLSGLHNEGSFACFLLHTSAE